MVKLRVETIHNVESLRRYTNQTLSSLEPAEIKGILSYLNNMNIEVISGTYLTQNDFETAFEAREFLALTYPPQNKYILSRSDDAQFMRAVTGTYLPRVWPAFGHPGGGTEYLLVAGKLKCEPAANYKLPAYCQNDAFRQESTDFYSERSDGIEEFLILVLFLWLRVSILSDPPYSLVELRLYLKHIAEIGCVIQFPLREGFDCAISCAFCEKPRPYGTTKLKFWGYTWKDDSLISKLMKRYICRPIIRIYETSSGITRMQTFLEPFHKQMQEDPEKSIAALEAVIKVGSIPKESPFSNEWYEPLMRDVISITKYLTEIKEELRKISPAFEENIEREIELPPIE